MSTRSTPILLFVCAAALVAAGCAGVNLVEHQPDASGSVAGIIQGFWHGLWVLPAFILSLFVNGISIYDANNNGGWYDFGYLVGIGAGGGIFGGSARAVWRSV